MKPEQNILNTSDAAVVEIVDGDAQILLITRHDNGLFALPGGVLNDDETYLQAAVRECREETGISIVGAESCTFCFDETGRDPRGRAISMLHLFIGSFDYQAEGGDDAKSAAFYLLKDVLEWPRSMFFADHYDMLVEVATYLEDRDGKGS